MLFESGEIIRDSEKMDFRPFSGVGSFFRWFYRVLLFFGSIFHISSHFWDFSDFGTPPHHFGSRFLKKNQLKYSPKTQKCSKKSDFGPNDLKIMPFGQKYDKLSKMAEKSKMEPKLRFLDPKYDFFGFAKCALRASLSTFGKIRSKMVWGCPKIRKISILS